MGKSTLNDYMFSCEITPSFITKAEPHSKFADAITSTFISMG